MQTAPPPARASAYVRYAMWGGVFLAAAGLIQVQIPGVFDGDTGYHLAIARLTRAHGVLHEFPWTPFSWLDAHYADKELLFHALLLPLSELPLVTASRIAGTVLGGGLLLTLYAILDRERVPHPGLFALAALASSSAFVARFAMVRPHLLSISLALVITWAAARKQRVVLAACCVLYPLCYTAWHLPLAAIALVEAARWLGTRRIDWRGAPLAAAALGVGILAHPNFPNTAELFWIQNAQILFGTAWSGVGGVDLGGEFGPFSVAGLGRYVLIPALLATGGAVLTWRTRGQDVLPLAFATVALAFLVMTLRTQRFIEYLAPFAVVGAALGVHAARGTWPGRWSRAFAPALVATGVVFTLLFARHPFELLRTRVDPFPAPVAERVAAIVPPGAQVVTCDWRLTGEMMLALPERRFIVALDPMFLALNDPERHRIWHETVRTPPPEPAVLLRDTFEASYVLCGEQHRFLAFHQALEADPAAALRGIIGLWRIYELRPKHHDPPLASN